MKTTTSSTVVGGSLANAVLAISGCAGSGNSNIESGFQLTPPHPKLGGSETGSLRPANDS